MKAPQDFAAGLFLLGLAAIGFYGSINLSFGALNRIEAGFMPRIAALMVAGLGVVLVISSFLSAGSKLDRWSLRGPFFVLGAALLFAWTIRPLGLAVAGPLAVIFSSLADKDTRLVETTIFAVVMTALCVGLFGFLLRLPIPILPTSLPYPLNTLF